MKERLWFKIGETAKRVGVTPKELRYWERVIPEIKPRRSRGNLRYYHLDELPRLQRIKEWLTEGLTVADCKELLRTGHLTRALDMGLDTDPSKALSSPQADEAFRGGSPARLTRDVPHGLAHLGPEQSPIALSTAAKVVPAALPQERLKAIHEALKTLHARLAKAP